jgi:plasmid stabilization system protein ParE
MQPTLIQEFIKKHTSGEKFSGKTAEEWNEIASYIGAFYYTDDGTEARQEAWNRIEKELHAHLTQAEQERLETNLREIFGEQDYQFFGAKDSDTIFVIGPTVEFTTAKDFVDSYLLAHVKHWVN